MLEQPLLRPDQENAYAHVIEHLKSKQIRITETRKAVTRYMIAAAHHPSAEQIYQDLLPMIPGMSLATVYNNLRVLVEAGFVSELKLSNDNTTYFDFLGHEHLHVVCESCGKIADIMDADVSIFKQTAQSATGYKISKEQFLLYGICPNCQNN
ncbi:Fur family transcriptional regulator [Streptococcus entericus]|uniref:Fur family transcriptional regulator n=1 Tax=Streptococcus entericus TaxID=155680 RepID=UPI00035CD832|nr:Fur family transcriptional regulator [Streptococcus entericus]